jgi:hypothetical protein
MNGNAESGNAMRTAQIRRENNKRPGMVPASSALVGLDHHTATHNNMAEPSPKRLTLPAPDDVDKTTIELNTTIKLDALGVN